MSKLAANAIKSEKLPLWRKIGYGVGDIYGGGSMVVVNFFWLFSIRYGAVKTAVSHLYYPLSMFASAVNPWENGRYSN